MLILIWQLENICIVLKYRKKSIVQTVYQSLHRNSLKLFYYYFMDIFKCQKNKPCINYLNNNCGIFYEVTQF